MPTTTIQPASQDTYAIQQTPTTTQGGVSVIDVGWATGGQNIGYVQFTLPSDFAGANVTAASLQLYCSLENATPDVIIRPENASASWNESTLSWNNKPPSGNLWTGSNVTITGTGWKTFDLLGLAQGWANGTIPNYGTCLNVMNGASTTYAAEFDSSSGATSTQRPKLTLTYTLPPNAPNGLTRSNFDATRSSVFTWTPDPNDPQNSYKLEIYDTANLATPAVSVPQTSTTIVSYTLAVNTLQNGKTYQWRVMTYDLSGVASQWSSYATFKCSSAPTASVTDPVANASIASTSYAFKGSYTQTNNVLQQSFQFKLWDNAGTAIVQDSGTIVGTSNQNTFSSLVNNTSYKIEFIVTSQDSITASSGKVTFSVATNPPAVPTGITVTNDTTNARVTASFTNPAGTPAAASNNVYRRKQGDSTWKQIKQGATSPYYDYLCPAGYYEYSVTAVSSDSSESAKSTAVQVTSSFSGDWIIDETTPSANVKFLYNNTNPDINTEEDVSFVRTFAKYPFKRRGAVRYHTGTLSALYLKQDADILTQIDAVDAMANSDRMFVLKMMNGRIYRVSLSAPKYKTKYGNGIADLTVTWTEVGDV